MKKSIFRKLKSIDKDSIYIPVKRDGRDVIRIGSHLPDPRNLFSGSVTGKCENIYLIFVKSKINEKRQGGIKLSQLIQSIESNNPKERIKGEIELNNLLVKMGNDIQKGINYQIIDGNTERETEKAVDNVMKMLKTGVFAPLRYISNICDLPTL